MFTIYVKTMGTFFKVLTSESRHSNTQKALKQCYALRTFPNLLHLQKPFLHHLISSPKSVAVSRVTLFVQKYTQTNPSSYNCFSSANLTTLKSVVLPFKMSVRSLGIATTGYSMDLYNH